MAGARLLVQQGLSLNKGETSDTRHEVTPRADSYGQFNDNSLRKSVGPRPDCRVVNTELCVVKNRTYMRCFYCIEGVHNTPIESSEFRFIGLVLELVVRGPSFLICVKPGHGYTTSLPPHPHPARRVIISLSRARCGIIRLRIVICSAVDIHYPQAQHYMSVEEKHLAQNTEMIQQLKSSGFPLML